MVVGEFDDLLQTIPDSDFDFAWDVSVKKSLRNAFQFGFCTFANVIVERCRFLVRRITTGINRLDHMQQRSRGFVLNGEFKRDVHGGVVFRGGIDGNEYVVKSRQHDKLSDSDDI